MSHRGKCKAVLSGVVILAFLFGGTAAAQQHSGNLYGRVVDNQGEPLPGVTVTLTGPGAPMVQVSNARGEFRFLGLSPGRYGGKAELDGFSTVDYPNIHLSAGRNTSIEVTLTPAVEEVITVTSESPILDQRKAEAGTTVTGLELDKIPVARDPWAVLQSVPGVLVDRINVGGNESGQQPSFVVGGGSRDQHTYLIDGVDITDPAALGKSPTYFNFESFEEFSFATGGSDASISSAGVTINLVTKRGTNTWRGSGRYFLTDSDWGSSLDPGAEQRGGHFLGSGVEFGAELGGPIIKDRLWIWGAVERDDISREVFAAGVPTDATFTSDSWTAKLNAQISDRNRLTAFVQTTNFDRLGEGASSTRAPEATWTHTGPTDILKLEDTHIFNSNFYLTGLYARANGGFGLEPRGGSNLGFDDRGIFRGSYFDLQRDWTANQWQLDGSYFFNTGRTSHELRFGTLHRGFDETRTAGWGANQLTFFDSFPEPIAVFPTRNTTAVELNETAIYVQDTLTWGNFTVNAGFRYDTHSGSNGESTVAANPLRPTTVPGGTFAGDDPDLSWNLMAPRLGATYDIFGNGKSKIYASWGRFLSKIPADLVRVTNPVEATGTLRGAEAFRFRDDNQNGTFDTNELRGQSIFIGGLPVNNPQFFTSPHQLSTDLSGPYKEEFLGGIEFEVARSVSLGVRYIHRSIPQILADTPLIHQTPGETGRPATRNDFEPGQFVSGTDLGGTPFDFQTFRLRQPFQYTGGFHVGNSDREQQYEGLSLTFNKRLANRWMLRGHFTFQDWTWDVPSTYFDDANNLLGSDDNNGAPVAEPSLSPNKAGVFMGSGWSYSLNGFYDLGDGWGVATSVFGREGYPAPSFARLNGGDRTRNIEVSPIDAFRNDDVAVIDLRLEKEFTFQDFGLTLSLDGFNVLNEQYVLQRNGNVTGSAPGFVDEVLSPRVWRLGVRINWR